MTQISFRVGTELNGITFVVAVVIVINDTTSSYVLFVFFIFYFAIEHEYSGSAWAILYVCLSVYVCVCVYVQ